MDRKAPADASSSVNVNIKRGVTPSLILYAAAERYRETVKNLLKFGLAVFFACTIFSCVNFGGMTNTQSKADAVETPLSVTADTLTINGPFVVELVNGSGVSAVMTEYIYENYLDIITGEDGAVTLQPKKNFYPVGFGSLMIRIGINSVRNIKINTDRPVSVPVPLTGRALSLELGGATSGRILSNINNLNLTLSTPYTVRLRGTADTMALKTSSVARLDMRFFTCPNIIEEIAFGSAIRN
jgi:hypothetical protein